MTLLPLWDNYWFEKPRFTVRLATYWASQVAIIVKNPHPNGKRKRHRFDPWAWKIPWRRALQPTGVFLLENPMDRGAWWATVHRVWKSQTRLK